MSSTEQRMHRSVGSSAKPFNGTRWTDNKTKDSLMAEFIEVKDKSIIRLRSRGGTIHEVPLNSLESKDIYRAIERDVMRRSREK